MRHLRFALLITGSICVALSQNALGDGFPEAQYSPRSVYNWTGFYAGAHLGGTWGTTEAFDNLGYNAVGDSWDADTSGFVAGVQLGYNWQAGPILFGIEGDVGNLGLTGSAPTNFPLVGFDTSTQTEAEFYLTARGRLGFVVNDWLIYGTGGYFGPIRACQSSIPARPILRADSLPSTPRTARSAPAGRPAAASRRFWLAPGRARSSTSTTILAARP